MQVCWLAGCVTLSPHETHAGADAQSEGIRERAEVVFRHQNRLMSRIMFLLPQLKEERPDAHERLAKAEQRMSEACYPLNRIAVKRSRGESVHMPAKARAAAAIDDCGRAARRAERLLETLDDGAATDTEAP